MSEVPTPNPHEHWVDPELRQLPGERGPRKRRGARFALIALIVSIVLHLAALSGCVGLLLLLIPLRPPPPPEPPPESIQVFVQPTPIESPDVPPPDTNNISDRNTEANSPGQGEPSPAGGGAPSLGGTPSPSEPPAGEPPPEPEPQPKDPPKEPQLHPIEPVTPPPPDSQQAKRDRLSQALRGMGGRSTELGEYAPPGDGGKPSSGLGFSYGDSGFQIESQADVDWGPWGSKMQRLVRSNWYSVIPVAARVGMKGIVRVRFVVHRDGTITDYELLDSAGLLPLDQAVQTALVNLSNPLPPLPLRETDEDTIRITYTFLYNLSDERERRAWERQRWLEKKRAESGG